MAQRIAAALDGTPELAQRWRESVVAVISRVGPSDSDEPGQPDEPSGEPGAAVRTIAVALTERARQQTALPEELMAAACAQDVAWELTPDAERPGLLHALTEALGPVSASIRVVPGGPHVLTGVGDLSDHLGRQLPTRPLMTLCRCGRSTVKPACNGVCVRDGFDDAKDPDRVPDRRDNYPGVQVEVLDNRGICQHSGLCTDRIGTVFRAGQEPFVAPSGGRMDEIVRAVRGCPSGALSLAMDGVEAREQVDHGNRRTPAVMITKDGPYRVTGGIRLVNADGSEVVRNQGASYEHYALCRCGHAQNKPFCSGMHWYVNFTDPVADPDASPSVFEWAGGMPALLRLTQLFYEKHVAADPLLAPLFANMSADHPERVAKWLAEVLGGPSHYSDEYGGYPRMLGQHIGKQLSEQQRARWVQLLFAAAADAGLPNDAEFRAAFGSYIEWGSRLAVENSQSTSRPPEHMPMPHWDWTTAAGPPSGRVSALAAPAQDDDPPVVLPAADEPVRFEKHVKTFFRRRDRQSMLFAFDLWNLADVTAHGPAILERLRNGTMPCDGAWPTERTDAFARWIDTGMSA